MNKFYTRQSCITNYEDIQRSSNHKLITWLIFLQSIDESYVHAVPVPPSIAKEEEEGERKMTRVSKLVNRVLDKYEKLPASLKDHINLEEMLGMKMKRSVETQNTTSRGPQHPINEKLERFKVRPVFPYEEDNKN